MLVWIASKEKSKMTSLCYRLYRVIALHEKPFGSLAPYAIAHSQTEALTTHFNVTPFFPSQPKMLYL
jgi:hypothetical protein